MMDDTIIRQLTVGAFSDNGYIAGSTKTGLGLVIDPGGSEI
jgi:hypothetical protein